MMTPMGTNYGEQTGENEFLALITIQKEQKAELV